MRARSWASTGTLGAVLAGLIVAYYNVWPAGHRQGPACRSFGRHVHLPFNTIVWP
jgi:hypothetical protein